VIRVAMCEEFRKKTVKNKPPKNGTMVISEKKCSDEPHPMSNEKTQPIQWTEQPTGALVTAGSLWPRNCRL